MSRTHATRREFAGRAVAEMARTAAQRWRAGAVPRTPSDITPDWLSALLERRVDEIAVCDEEQGTATRARLALSGNDVPATVFVKTTPTRPIERLFHNVFGLGETEAVFYRLVAPEIAECTPAVYGTQWDTHTGRSVVVIEDLAARDIRFADAAVACTADEAAIMARTLAACSAGIGIRRGLVPTLRDFHRRKAPRCGSVPTPPFCWHDCHTDTTTSL